MNFVGDCLEYLKCSCRSAIKYDLICSTDVPFKRCQSFDDVMSAFVKDETLSDL